MCGTEELSSKPALNKCSLPSDNGTKLEHNNHLSSDSLINLDHGDPTVYEAFWGKMGDKCTLVIKGNDLMSYMSDMSRLCWFLEPELEEAIKRLHRVAGNAVVEDRYIVVGTGSTQLYQAVLYALTAPGGGEPVDVVSAAPYYSQYPAETDLLCSGLYKWGGDAYAYDKDGPYIEVVTSPNNPDGTIREAVVNNGGEGKVFYDLAYYWPQYTPITRPADYDIMYFTFSKSTGHAGSRIGWALVKDEEIARKMTRFVELSSIGVSKDSQIRAAKIMGAMCDSYQDFESGNPENFFEFAHQLMAKRWKRLREVVAGSEVFSLPKYPKEYCLFHGEFTESYPAYAWLKSKDGIEDCEKLLRDRYKIAGRGGRRFGVDPSFARVSMLSRAEVFEQFLNRLLGIKGIENGN